MVTSFLLRWNQSREALAQSKKTKGTPPSSLLAPVTAATVAGALFL